ncbi:MAG: C25 family cysteine peptidase [Armatimonadetes bacterium]|nr:C25 family cysteine peptidase [Armatimonadota bacterium]
MKPAVLAAILLWVTQLSGATAIAQESAADGARPQDRPGLVVVCPAAWLSEMAPYVAARSAEFDVQCVALEDAMAGEDGMDAPERLKKFLYRQWREGRLQYALLVGDAATFPVRWMVLDRKTEPAYNYAFYASDLYYADLAREDGTFDDWNAQRNGFHGGYFGEVRGEHIKDSPINYDGISYVPEIAVGRWPVGEVAELRAVIAKTIEWERRLLSGPPKALVLHAGGWVDVRERLGAMADSLATAGWQTERQFFGGEKPMPTPETVKAAILGGLEMVLHAGHGNAECWDACIGPAEREALAAASPAVYFSVGCGTAHFAVEPPYDPYLDAAGILHRGTNNGEVFRAEPPPPASLQPGRLNSTGLGKRLLLMPRAGAVAYIGCNTGAQPCAMSLLEGFVKSVAGGASRVGDAWKDAVGYYWRAEKLADLAPTDDWYPPSIFFQGMKFMLFGDPALSLPKTATP